MTVHYGKYTYLYHLATSVGNNSFSIDQLIIEFMELMIETMTSSIKNTCQIVEENNDWQPVVLVYHNYKRHVVLTDILFSADNDGENDEQGYGESVVQSV